MRSEQDILAALRMLAESDREKTPSLDVEIRLRQVFRRKRNERVWKRAAAWTVAAAAVVTMIATYQWRPRAQPVKPAVQPAVQQSAPPAEIAHTPSIPARKVARARQGQPREIVTEFFPLVDIAPPFERGELVRVNLPAAAMRTAGLPVREDRLEDRVQADVLVSEEGLPRAIRFVKYSQ